MGSGNSKGAPVAAPNPAYPPVVAHKQVAALKTQSPGRDDSSHSTASTVVASTPAPVGPGAAPGLVPFQASGFATVAAPPAGAGLGASCFIGTVADKYLKEQKLSSAILDDWTWPQKHSDAVAAAILAWGKDNGATVFTHWFQPLGANNVRPGGTGQVHNNMMTFQKNGQPIWKFSGKDLLRGETDGSSYPNGGMRATHTAGGYTVLDASSPIFMRGDTIYIPTIFMSWTGLATDEKIPLLRSCEALSREGKRLLKNLGFTASGVVPNIGLEQEFFFVPRTAYARRMDLQLTGRTVLGKAPPRGQEMSDHYMAPPNQVALECMAAIQQECYKLGIPLKTRHREVAPNQYEFAPYFGYVTSQIDQNLMVMQICEEVSARYGLACLFQEKPFAGINGSGKHNNWSVGTPEGLNLLNAEQTTTTTGSPDVFNAIVACIVSGVDKHGDLMRMSIASPGNDFRLGCMEAPPAVMSTYLGADLTSHLEKYMAGGDANYKPSSRMLSAGLENIAAFEVPSEDRNRTSPFPYGGHRFEFRAVGSSQNVSMVNTVLNTLTAEAFKDFSDKLEAGRSARDITTELLKTHWKCVFNGNGYAEDWPDKAVEKGIWRIDSGIDAYKAMGSDKNVALFEKMKVMNKEELEARVLVNYAQYVGQVEMECLCMVDMLNQQIIPAVKAATQDASALSGVVSTLKAELGKVHAEADPYQQAVLARKLRLETMVQQRDIVDDAEAHCPSHLWPVATYKDLLFLDSQQDGHGQTTGHLGVVKRE
jgi:glutamine synthetase